MTKRTFDIVCCTNSTKAATACRSIRQVYREVAVDNSTYCRWFWKFKEIDRSYHIEARCARPSLVGEEAVDQAMKKKPGEQLKDGWNGCEFH